MLYNLEVPADDSYMSKDRFTKSFSPSDSFEDILSAGECDGETKVLFCKSLDITSDEDDDKKGIKRTFEETRDSRCFEPRKKPYKSANEGKSQRSSNYSLRSFRAFRSPSSILSTLTGTSVSRGPKPKFTRFPAPKSDKSTKTSTKTKSDGPMQNLLVRREAKLSEMSKKIQNNKKQGKENRSKYENEEVTVYEKTIITMTSSDQFITGKSLEQLNGYSDTRPNTDKSQDTPIAMREVSQNSAIPLERYTERMNRLRMPTLESLLGELCDKSVPAPPSHVEIKVLPAIEEKTESLSSRSCRSKNTHSYSFTESYTSSGSEFSSRSKPISSPVKMNFGNVSIKRRARLVIEKPGRSKMFPNSCLKKESKSTSSTSAISKSSPSKQLQKKSVKFLIDEDNHGTEEKLVQKKSARLEKYPDQLKMVKRKKSDKKRKSSDYVAAPVIVSIQESISTQLPNQREDKTMSVVVKGQNVHEQQLVGDLGFLRNWEAYRSMYALLQPRISVVQGTHSVKITELNQDEQRPQINTVGSCKKSSTLKSSAIDRDNAQIIHAISDMVMTEMNDNPNNEMISKKAISAGPSNANTKRQSRLSQQESLEARRKLIRVKLGERSNSPRAEGDNDKTDDKCKEADHMVGSSSRIVTKDQLRAERSPVQRRGRKGTAANGHVDGNVKMRTSQVVETFPDPQSRRARRESPNLPANTVRDNSETTRRNIARSNALRNLQGAARSNANTKCDWPVSSGTESPLEGSHPQESIYLSFESNSGESYQTTDTRRRRMSLSPRPPSRRPHLSPSSRRTVSARAEPTSKSPGPPRTLLTMKMQSKHDPKTASTVLHHLGSEIPNTIPLQVETSIPATQTFANDKLARLKTEKNAGHPLQGISLADFIEGRHRKNIRDTSDRQVASRKTASRSQKGDH